MKKEFRIKAFGCLGETPLLLTLFRELKCDCVFECVPCFKNGIDQANILKHFSRIEFTNNPISIEETIRKYSVNHGDSPYAHSHAIKTLLWRYGVTAKDYIPKIIFDSDEISWAIEFLSKYHNPIPLLIFSGGYKTNDSCALTRMLSFDKNNIIIESLTEKGYTPLSITTKNHHIDLNKNFIPILNLNFRQQAAIFNVCKKVISIESGQSHLALASGAIVYRLVPTFGYSNGFLYSNWNYTEDMWSNEQRRIFDYLHDDFLMMLSNF